MIIVMKDYPSRPAVKMLLQVLKKDFENGLSPLKIAQKYEISLSVIYRYLKRAGFTFKRVERDPKTGHFIKRW